MLFLIKPAADLQYDQLITDESEPLGSHFLKTAFWKHYLFSLTYPDTCSNY